jgi:magnesium-transporting ATPase (P-type)
MTWVLILAITVSYGTGSVTEGSFLIAVVVSNIVVGFYHENSAEKAIDSLPGWFTAPAANVVRDGYVKKIPSSQLVPGDLVKVYT